ncbi:MAG TPA: methyl-accepting chemotaxis protein, partial [Xanthobacteraceae bacterium]|nr:methyl-accepting chemotaxis protein [Xanthobacteraceae bacterium]
MFQIRRKVRLTHRIALIGAIGALGVFIVGVIYLVGAFAQNAHQRRADQAEAMLTMANGLYAKMLESRRSEKDFMLRSDMQYADAVGALAKAITADIDTLRLQSGAAGLDDLTQKIVRLGDGLKTYETHFSALVAGKQHLGLDEKSGLEGTFHDSVHAMEDKLDEFDDTRLLVAMLAMRRQEADSMRHRDPQYGDAMKKLASEFTAHVNKASLAPMAKTDLKQVLAAYQKDFVAWMDTALAVDSEETATGAAYAAIEPDINGILGAVRTVYADAGSANQVSRDDTMLRMMIAILVMAIGVSALSWWMGRLVSRPVAAMARAMGELAQGRNEIEIPGADRDDEIGQMAKAVLVFRDAALEKERLEGVSADQRRQAEAQQAAAEEERRRNAEAQAAAAEEQAHAVKALADGLAKLSEGDLTARLSEGFTEAYQQIKNDFNATIGRLQETINAIAASTSEVTNASAEISTSTTDLSKRTEQQSASLEQTSASLEEIYTTVKKNAESAQEANQATTGTRAVADRGGQVVAKAVAAMARIDESSRKISDIIGVIDEIARQTNLLALNAAVEAARAGDAGRGFAVVASEVRSLAQRASQAAKDIKDLITNSNGQVREGVDLVNQAGGALTEIVESIKTVAGIVSDIAAASTEQANGIDQVNRALAQMDQVTQQNSALVEENAATAKTLQQQAAAMDDRVGFFRLTGEPGDSGEPVALASKRPTPAAQA